MSNGLRNADRYVSPDGERIAVIDYDSGEVWISTRQSIPQAAAVLRDLPNWRLLAGSRGPAGARSHLAVVREEDSAHV